MTRTEIERLSVVESQIIDVQGDVKEVKESQVRIEQKLDNAISCKADKSEVQAVADAVALKANAEDFREMRKLLVGILIAVAGFALTTIVGIIIASSNIPH